MGDINILAAIVAAISSFALGAVWYAEPIFGKLWMRELNYDQSQAGHPGKVFGTA